MCHSNPTFVSFGRNALSHKVRTGVMFPSDDPSAATPKRNGEPALIRGNPSGVLTSRANTAAQFFSVPAFVPS